MRKAFTVKSLASILGVGQKKVLGWIHSGELLAINIAERTTSRPSWRIPEEAWEAFLVARSNRATIVPASTPRRRRRREQGDTIKFYPEQ